MWKSRLQFAGALSLSLLMIMVSTDKTVGYTLLYALGFLALFSLVTVLLAPRLIRVEESAEGETIIKNEELAYRSRIVNRGLFFYPRLEAVYHNPELLGYGDKAASSPSADDPAADGLAVMPPRGRKSRKCSVRFPFRGVYNLGIKTVTVTDMLGLFRRTIHVKAPLSVTVFPESDEGFAWSVRNEPQNSSLNTDLFNEDYSSVADVRKYTSSDSLRKVHWKLSAKRGELIVKNFHSFDPGRTILLLDTRAIPLGERERAAFEDKMVSYVAAAINHCMWGRLTTDFIFGEGDEDFMVIEESEDLGEVYTHLAEIRFAGDRSALASAHMITGAYNMVVFLCGIDPVSHDVLKDLVSFDHNIVLYSFWSPGLPPDGDKEALLESLRAYGVGVNKVEIGGEAG